MKSIRKIFSLIFVLTIFMVSICLVGCDGRLTIGSSITSSDVYVGEVLRLYSNADELGLEEDAVWVSSDPTVASVDEEGMLKALKAGVTTITVSYGEKTISAKITVLDREESVTINITGPQTVNISDTITLTASLSNGASFAGCNWSSSNSLIATVDNDGNVKGVSGGLCTITATSKDNSSITGSLIVYVVVDSTDLQRIINEIYQVAGELDFSSLSENVVDIIQDNIGSVVGVSNYQNKTYVDKGKQTTALVLAAIGTGSVIKKEETSEPGTYTYYVLTNNHVIDESDQVKVYIQPIEKDINATIVALDADIDLAVVKFTYNIDLKPALLGDISEVVTGSFVIAIGHPTGYEYFNSATFGIASYVNRKMSNEKALYIQHDAAINSGNSGGPLFDMSGKIVGVNTLKLASDNIDNMGFAVSIDTVRGFLQENNLLP